MINAHLDAIRIPCPDCDAPPAVHACGTTGDPAKQHTYTDTNTHQS